MPLFRTQWTAHEADEWTKEDFWACVFSSLSYVFLMVGLALCFLFPLWGILLTLLGAVFVWLMYAVIDPKLRKISADYETKQKDYLRNLDRIMKWEEE
jgi:glycopeptide antibiotics resistance protein